MVTAQTIEERIKQFLRDYPNGPLQVAVGFASIWGLAWLHRHTQGRPVNLLIGDTQKKHFKKATRADKKAALEFLRRDDVTVSNWYKKHGGKSDAHMKAWLAAEAGKFHLLTGSANLSKQGLRHNHEQMVEPVEKDLEVSVAGMEKLYRMSWDCGDRLMSYIRGDRLTTANLPTLRKRPAASEQWAQKVWPWLEVQPETGERLAPIKQLTLRAPITPSKLPIPREPSELERRPSDREPKIWGKRESVMPGRIYDSRNTDRGNRRLAAWKLAVFLIVVLVIAGVITGLAINAFTDSTTTTPDATVTPAVAPTAAPVTATPPSEPTAPQPSTTTPPQATTPPPATTTPPPTATTLSAAEVLPEDECRIVRPAQGTTGCFIYIQGAAPQYGTDFKVLHLRGIDGLATLPQWVAQRTDIDTLNIENNGSLVAIPDWIGEMSNLKRLVIIKNQSLPRLPETIGNLTGLRRLEIHDNPALLEIPETIGNLQGLIGIVIERNRSAADIPAPVMNSLCDLNQCKTPDGFNSLVRGEGLSIDD